jgi:hypothetical protein
MLRTALIGLFALTTAAPPPAAQPATARLRWEKGQVLVYKVEQTTVATDAVGDKKVETKTQLNLVKRWQVMSVDAAGVATLQLSLNSLRLETTVPGGDPLLFDSANLDKSTPEMKDQMSKYTNAPLALLRVDGYGQVVEVKESKFGPPSRFENELPFLAILPAQGPTKAGQTWERAYKVTLEPPQGAGEKYDAVQKYTSKTVADGLAAVAFAVTLKSPPAAPADQVPLLQMQPEGEVVYDVKAGRMKSAAWSIDKEVKGHQGDDSTYHLKCNYSEQYLGDK